MINTGVNLLTKPIKHQEAARHPGYRILSYQDLRNKGIKLSRQWILRFIREGKFPRPVRLGEASAGFIEAEIDAWIEGLIAERDGE